MQIKSIKIDDILVADDRIREVDHDEALALSLTIETNGFNDPVSVYQTSNGARPYTLIDGAHRLHAARIAKMDSVWAAVLVLDGRDPKALEAEANLFRHMTKLDRALSIYAYRRAWEKVNGKIRTGPNGITDKMSLIAEGEQSDNMSVCPTDAVAGLSSKGFSAFVAERLGMNERGIERAVRIAGNLSPELIGLLRGTGSDDHQTTLLHLVGLDRDAQFDIVDAVQSGAKTLDQAIEDALATPDTSNKAQAVYLRTLSTISRMDKKDRRAAIQGIAEAHEADFSAIARGLGWQKIEAGK